MPWTNGPLAEKLQWDKVKDMVQQWQGRDKPELQAVSRWFGWCLRHGTEKKLKGMEIMKHFDTSISCIDMALAPWFKRTIRDAKQLTALLVTNDKNRFHIQVKAQDAVRSPAGKQLLKQLKKRDTSLNRIAVLSAVQGHSVPIAPHVTLPGSSLLLARDVEHFGVVVHGTIQSNVYSLQEFGLIPGGPSSGGGAGRLKEGCTFPCILPSEGRCEKRRHESTASYDEDAQGLWPVLLPKR